MNWITVNKKRINADALVSYGIDEDGDSYVIWSHGGMTKYQGPAFAEALDRELGIASAACRSGKNMTSLREFMRQKLGDRQPVFGPASNSRIGGNKVIDPKTSGNLRFRAFQHARNFVGMHGKPYHVYLADLKLEMQNEHSRQLGGTLCNDDDARQGKGCPLCLERYKSMIDEREQEIVMERI